VAVVVLVVIGIRIVGNVAKEAVDDAGSPERTTSGGVTEAGTTDPMNLKVGDCYHNGISSVDTTETVRSIEAIPCTERHNAQVISETTMSGAYPPASRFIDKCTEQAKLWAQRYDDAYRALEQRDPNFTVSAFFPLSAQWDSTGPNRVTCSLVSSTGHLGGRLPTL